MQIQNEHFLFNFYKEWTNQTVRWVLGLNLAGKQEIVMR